MPADHSTHPNATFHHIDEVPREDPGTPVLDDDPDADVPPFDWRKYTTPGHPGKRPTNAERAERARRALADYLADDPLDPQAALSDLLADLRHLDDADDRLDLARALVTSAEAHHAEAKPRPPTAPTAG